MTQKELRALWQNLEDKLANGVFSYKEWLSVSDLFKEHNHVQGARKIAKKAARLVKSKSDTDRLL